MAKLSVSQHLTSQLMINTPSGLWDLVLGRTTFEEFIQMQVKNWLRSELNRDVASISMDQPFSVLGIDSAGAVAIAAAIERRFGVNCSPPFRTICVRRWR